VIPGFNTDVEYDGVVYHVQTEDKGARTQTIMSLVYDGGTILASKRTSYVDIIEAGLGEDPIAQRLQKQHKLICAAVRSGRINELREMTAKAGAGTKTPSAPPPVVTETAIVNAAEAFSTPIERPSGVPLKIEIVEGPAPIIELDETIDGEIVIDAVHIIEDDEILAADAVAVVSELSGKERPTHTKLNVELLGQSNFRGGDRGNVSIMICRGTDRRVVAGAQIMVKVLGSSFRPIIFHAKSDANGLARIHLQIPHFAAGRAALLVRVISDDEEIELRRIVSPG